MMSSCRYCLTDGAPTTRVSNYKHVWTVYRCCGTMARQNKDRYPADPLIAQLARWRLGAKVANRLFPPFMRRENREAGLYAAYGRAFDHVFGPPIDHAFLDMKRRRYLGEADEIIALFRASGIDIRDKSVLDVSGGPGSFAHLIRDAVAKVSVTEYDEASVRSMQEKLPGTRVFQADVNGAWTDTELFDVWLYRSCIYFCFDLRAHLAEVRDHVTAGGYVFISTNTPTLGNALRWQYEDYTHNVFYHPETVTSALEANGFSIVASGLTSFYRHFLDWYTPQERLYYRWGLWHLLNPRGPRGTDARSGWVLARKR